MIVLAWRLFRWGSRGFYYDIGAEDVYVAARFIPNTVRVVMRFQGPEGQTILNIFHARTGGPVAYGDCFVIATSFINWWSSQYKNMVNNTYYLNSVTAVGIDRFNSAQDVEFSAVAGSRIGPAWAPEQTLCVKASTHTAGRRYRGRVYPLPGVSSDLINPDRVTLLYRSAITGVLNNLLAQMNTAGYPLVVASLVNQAAYPIAQWVAVDDALDTQRRRMLGDSL